MRVEMGMKGETEIMQINAEVDHKLRHMVTSLFCTGGKYKQEVGL